MGGKSSKRVDAGRFGSISKSQSRQGYSQSPYHQPSQANVPPPTQSYLKKKLKKKYFRINDDYKSLPEVTEALDKAGLESSNLIIGIDYTKSNEWTGERSFQGRSLHHIGIDQNPYEEAISIIGRTLASFDEDNLIPCFGFGDASTHDIDVFSFYPDEHYCEGFEEVLKRYRELVPKLRLSGPTSFAPIIEMATTIVEQNGGQYHVLLLIADGQVTRSNDTEPGQLSQQEKNTIEAIVKASKYPLSIVLVGVGDGPWDMMREFDDNIPARAFDNFQFVNFTEIMSKKVERSKKEADFALAALMEIPSQYKATIELNLLGHCNGNDIQRVPLPPPCSRHASLGPTKTTQSTSLHPTAPFLDPTKISQSASLHPTAPFLDPTKISQSASLHPTEPSTNGGQATVGVQKSIFDNHLCPICIYNPKDMAFGCGHQMCCECGQDIKQCPICRSAIRTRIKLY